jgi:hypothetical protein
MHLTIVEQPAVLKLYGLLACAGQGPSACRLAESGIPWQALRAGRLTGRGAACSLLSLLIHTGHI